jgi:hypothetical protein
MSLDRTSAALGISEVMPHRTASGIEDATDIGRSPYYLARMAKREHPQLWVQVCKAAKLPPSASVDAVFAFYGGEGGVGRGTIQRINEGGLPRVSSLERIAERARVSTAWLMATNAPPPPPTPPQGFADRHQVSASDWALLQDIKSAAFESEIEAIRKRARELQRRVDERIAELKGKL